MSRLAMPPWLYPPVAAALGVFAIAWFVLGLVTPVPGWVGPVPKLLSLLIAALACLAVSGVAGLDFVARRGWVLAWLALSVVSAGVILDIVDVASRAGVPRPQPGPAAMACFVGGILVALLSMLILPAGRRSREQWLTFGMDLSVVALAVCTFVWYFAVWNQTNESTGPLAMWWTLGILVLSAVVALICGKAIMSGAESVDRRSLAAMATGILAGVSGLALPRLQPGQNYFTAGELSIPVAAAFVVLATELQRRAVTRPPRPARPRRPFSLMPYAAIAATDVLLLAATRELGWAGRAVVLCTVVIGALVVLRQIAAIHDNAGLLERLNGSMTELERQEERFRSLVQNASDIVLVADGAGHTTYVSPSIERVLGVPPEAWLGRRMLQYTHPDDREALQEPMRRLMESPGMPVTLLLRVQHADGGWRWLETVLANRLDDPGVLGIVGNARDVTETRRYQDRLVHQARHDALTGLGNRTLFNERAEAALAAAHGPGSGPVPGGSRVTLALVDLDDFKLINDRLGHAVGDALLVAVARRLQECIEERDTVARLGGDEFAILLQGRSAAGVDRMVQRIVTALETQVSAGGYDLLGRASIGLVEATPDMDASELLRRADVAMYSVKEQGKSGCLRYAEEMDTRAIEHARIGADLQHAMAHGELHLVYQPVVTLPDRRIVAVEALVRWNHPRRGPVSPVEFIPVAEHNGQIVGLGGWVLSEACRQLAAWRDQGLAAPARMNVNASARQLREPGFADLVARVLAETGLAPGELTIEITETAVFDGGPALETVQAIHALGVAIALDDFGTGHSSLGLLRMCPVDALKVDKSFIDEVAGTAEDAAIATSVVKIARAMGLRAVAEGVETRQQEVRLHELGYRLAQGFLFARPLPAADLTGLLAAGVIPEPEPRASLPAGRHRAPGSTAGRW